MGTVNDPDARCAICGQAYLPKTKRAGRRTETCSILCGNRLRGKRAAARNQRPCAVCAKPFTPKHYIRTPGDSPVRTETCSWACGTILRWRRAKPFISAKRCAQCGDSFSTITLGRRTISRNWDKQRFCGYVCVHESRRKRPAKEASP